MKICPLCSTEYPDGTRFCPNDGQTLRASSPAADLVGQVVADRYHILRKLGEGGMGQVYLAEHVKMGRQSAIKVMNPAMVHDPDAVARFNREAANASRITHPNVCAVYDFGETAEGLIYLAMEYIDGVPLSAVLEREGALPVRRAVDLCLQVAEALQAAHELGIVHRDLKPDNIMLTRGRSGQEVVKVVDFGIAKAVGGDAGGQKVTKTGLVIGTPEFMSPEQLAGDPVDGRSDIYSLALVLYRAITGRLPFEGETAQETMVKRLTDEPRPLAQARPDLPFPPGVQPCLDQALARLPAQRYQSAAKFAYDLAGAAGIARVAAADVPMPPTRPDAEAKTQPLDTAMRRQVQGATRRAAPPPRPAPAPPSAKRWVVPLVVGVVVVGGGWVGLTLLNGGRGNGGAPPPDSGSGQTTSVAGGRQGAGGPGPVVDTQTRRPPPPDTAGRGRPLPARADSAAVDRDLGEILELVLEPQTAADGRQRAIRHYNDASVPAVLRAQAAFMVANGYFIEQRRADACQWNARALGLAPANETYVKFRRDQACP